MRQRGIRTSVLVAFTLMVGPVWAEPEEPSPATEEPTAESGETSPAPSSDESEVDTKVQADEGSPPNDTESAPALEPVYEAPGETNLQVAEAEEVYVPDTLETTLVLGGSYAGAMLVANSPALLPGGGKWMGAMHLGLATASVVYAKDRGWKLIGGATFGTLAALNAFTDMREAGAGSRYATNVAVSLAIPLLLVGTYWGLEVWGQASDEPAVFEPIDGPSSSPEVPAEPEATSSLHLNVLPMADGAFASLSLKF